MSGGPHSLLYPERRRRPKRQTGGRRKATRWRRDPTIKKRQLIPACTECGIERPEQAMCPSCEEEHA